MLIRRIGIVALYALMAANIAGVFWNLSRGDEALMLMNFVGVMFLTFPCATIWTIWEE